MQVQLADWVSGFVTTTAFAAAGACAPVVPLRAVSLSTLTAPSATPPIVAVAQGWNAVPVIVTTVPPAEGPLAGEIAVTVGAAAGSYVYVHAQVADCESGLNTSTAFPLPGACAPVVPLRVVGPVTLTPVSGTPPIVAVAPDWKSVPNFTVALDVKSVPLIVTGVPPDEGPFAGTIPVTVGGGRLVQFANLKVPTRVCQLKVPLAVRYSVVYQNVQSSVGSSASEL